MEEDIKILKELVKANKSFLTELDSLQIKAIENILNRLQQDEKLINDMTEQLVGLAIWDNEKEETVILTQEKEVLAFFRKRVDNIE